jgi:hypothetical protein
MNGSFGRFFLSEKKPRYEYYQADDKKNKPEPCTDNNGMKQQAIRKRHFCKPVVIMFSVSGTQGHRYMAVQNGKHKWEAEKNGSGKRNRLADAINLACEEEWPGKNQEHRHRKRPVNQGNSAVITFA